MSKRATTIWTFVVVSVAVFMASLDNLIVTTALPVIKTELGATLQGLQWTVNAYTLTFAVLLLSGAALGDRFGRKRMFMVGISIFTAGSVLAALAPSISLLVVARAIQGFGGAIVTPLTLTILSAAVPPARRGLALGVWSGVGCLAIAIGPVIGGAIVESFSWQWVFWINVPIGLALLPLAWLRLQETTGPNRSLDLPGVGLASVGLFGIVWGLVRSDGRGWTSLGVAGPIAAGLVLIALFVWWEARSRAPMVPMRFFRRRSFSTANVTSMLMSFGMFGSVFLLAQFFQIVQGYSPFQAGLRTLTWTAMPILVAPLAGLLSDRIGSRPLLVTGMGMMAGALAWIAAVGSPTVPYHDLVAPFAIAGIGMSLYWAPVASVVLSAVRRDEEGKASGVSNTVREVGGVFGVAVLASIFSAVGGYTSPAAFTEGLNAALWIGAAVVGLGTVVALGIPGRNAILSQTPSLQTMGAADGAQVEAAS
jgi:EmrB/QacA subfamily drug resistance transporter